MPTTIALRRTRRGAALAVLIATALFVAASVPAFADGPTVDPSFGNGGLSVQARPHNATIYAILPLPGGGLLAAGQESTVGFLVARYRADGTLDPSFGTGGVTTTTIGSSGNANAGALALQGDKIVLEGTSWNASSKPVATVARYTASGQLDTTFASGVGWAQVPSGYARFGSALAIQADNKILVGGAMNGAVVIRLDADSGAPDATFGTGGVAGIPGNAQNCSDDASGGTNSLLVTAGGIVAGILCGGRNSTLERAGVARFTAGGVLDPSFGTGGVSTYPASPSVATFSAGLALTSTGSLVTALQNGLGGPPNTISALRWTSSGALDPAFGSGGIGPTFTFASSSTADAVAVDRSDRVIVAGADAAMSPTNGFGLMRLTAAGAIDPFWNGGAPLKLGVGGGMTEPLAVAVQSDGKILVAGITTQSGSRVLGVGRLIPPPEPVPPVTPPVIPPVTPPVTPPVFKHPGFNTVVKLPSARRCLSRRSFRIHLKRPNGVKVRSVRISVSGRRARTISGRRLSAPIDLRGLPNGRYTVRITVRLADGTVLRGSRSYRTCTPRRRAHHRVHD